MQPPDLSACFGVDICSGCWPAVVCVPKGREPMPRVAPRVPMWFQRMGAVLTVLGLVGAVRVLDRAAATHPRLDSQKAETTSLDAAAW